jgi:hypothetical protein
MYAELSLTNPLGGDGMRRAKELFRSRYDGTRYNFLGHWRGGLQDAQG